MAENRKAQQPRQAPGLRFGASFWDAVECEIEALDADDLELFLAGDRLPCQARSGAIESIGATLAALCRARFSN